jgi:DNA-binding NarL/FixJ family response regulator
MERPLTVLLVDDHAMVRSGFAMVLSVEDDIEVVGEAADGLEAIERARATRPDVVLMDVQMPRMDGLEATRQLRRLQREGELPPFPIIVLSAYHAPSERAACFDAGADGFVTKPLMIAKLATEIHRVMTRSPKGRARTATRA